LLFVITLFRKSQNPKLSLGSPRASCSSLFGSPVTCLSKVSNSTGKLSEIVVLKGYHLNKNSHCDSRTCGCNNFQRRFCTWLAVTVLRKEWEWKLLLCTSVASYFLCSYHIMMNSKQALINIVS